ncbi:MAG: carboxypeptidase-like regulatory domain-containing protein, partial [Pirellulaceae bacterium]
ANRHAVHRYIFRPGIDDVDDEFTYSPWITGQPNWWQFGRQFTRKNRMTIAWDQWGKGDKSVPAPEGKASFTLNAPGGEEVQLNHRAVCSQMVTQQLTLTEGDVNRLRLHRFSIPGNVRSTTYDVDCYRVHVQAAIPELDINQTLAAIVMPQTVVDKDPPGGWRGPDITIFPDSEPDAVIPVIPDEEPVQMPDQLRQQLEDSTQLPGRVDGTVKIEVIEGLGTVVLTGDPEDVEKVREMIEGLLEPQPTENDDADAAPDGAGEPADEGRVPPRWDGISEIGRDVRSIELVAGRGRILQFDHSVAEVIVESPELIRVTPIARDRLLVHALATGRSNVAVRGSDMPIRTIEVVATEAESEGSSVSIEVVGDSQAIILKGDPDELATVRAAIQRMIGVGDGEEAIPPSAKTPDESSDDDLSSADPGSVPVKTWTVVGTVNDAEGNPMEGVRVWAAAGAGTLRPTGETFTDENGTYELTFGPGMLYFQPNDLTNPRVGMQAASIYAAKHGYSEIHLCQAGDRLMAGEMPTEDTPWGSVDQIRDKLIFPGQPVTIDFMMQQATRIEGYLVDQNGHLLQRRSLSLAYGGEEIAPSTNVLAQVWTDRDAHFVIENVPLNKLWKLEFQIPNSRNEASTEIFQLSDVETHRRLVEVDLEANPPTITTSPLSDEQAEELSGRSMLQSSGGQHQIIRGQIPSEEDDRDLVFGDENKGLQAAIHFPNGRQAAIGDQLEMEFVIRNTSDEDVVFESDPWRQEDNFKLWKLGDQGREKKQDYAITWYSDISIMKEYHLGPGEEVIIDAGELFVLDPEGPEIELQHPSVWGASMEPGRYSAWFRIYLPRRFVQTDSWNGTVTTGEVEFEVTE